MTLLPILVRLPQHFAFYDANSTFQGCRLILHLYGFRDGVPYDDGKTAKLEEIDTVFSQRGRFTTYNETEIRDHSGLELLSSSESSARPEVAAAQHC
jgi:hypothetical protein